jgi:hypothetical protein
VKAERKKKRRKRQTTKPNTVDASLTPGMSVRQIMKSEFQHNEKNKMMKYKQRKSNEGRETKHKTRKR